MIRLQAKEEAAAKEGRTQTPQGCHGRHKESEEPGAVESTLAASLGDSLAVVTAALAVAAAPAGAAGEGTVAVTLTWETGAVYEHGATNYIQG